ncbi:unnamed protein product, partial [Laminaria digitata]
LFAAIQAAKTSALTYGTAAQSTTRVLLGSTSTPSSPAARASGAERADRATVARSTTARTARSISATAYLWSRTDRM